MPALEAGQRFEKYKIVEGLGASLSGESYVAEDMLLKRKVALKLLQPWKALPESTRRQFFREMQASSALNHPHLTPLLDYGEYHGQIFVARRFISAGSLLNDQGRRYFKPPLPIAEALKYTHQLAQALYTLHQQGYLHGSLTLSNILLLRTPNQSGDLDSSPFTIADANIAQFVRRYGQPAQDILPITAAPEQLQKRISTASDQFALAVILYYWLTGRFPYLGSANEIKQQKVSATLPSIVRLNPGVNVQQQAILFRALSATPEERYPTILAFSTGLIKTLTPTVPATPAVQQMPVLTPRPPAEPQPELLVLAAQPAPEPQQEVPVLATQPAPEPQPQPEKPTPEPEPQPVAPPTPLPQPEITPNPQPQILPEPEPARPEKQPEPGPAPERAPFPRPEPNPTPLPSPEIMPETPLPETTPGPVTPPQPSTPPEPQASEEAGEPTRSIYAENPRLEISSPYTSQPSTIFLNKEILTLGRAGASDILLEKDSLTSRHHALLRRENEGFVILDRQSVTGVKVNTHKLEPDEAYLLKDGDQVSIGNYRLTFRIDKQPVKVNTPPSGPPVIAQVH